MSDEKNLNNNLPEDEEYYEVDLVTLVDDEGVEHEFELAEAINYEGSDYVALIPSDQSPEEALAEDGEYVIMKRGVDENGEEYFQLIEDDDEFDAVCAKFYEIFDAEDEE